jgi:hypothetical protein
MEPMKGNSPWIFGMNEGLFNDGLLLVGFPSVDAVLAGHYVDLTEWHTSRTMSCSQDPVFIDDAATAEVAQRKYRWQAPLK